MRMEVGKMTMSEFAKLLTPITDQQVVDMTELKGSYTRWRWISAMEELMNLQKG